MSEEILNLLQKLASKKTTQQKSENNGDDFFNPNDYFGGNIDDAYFGGCTDGEIELAQKIMQMLNK